MTRLQNSAETGLADGTLVSVANSDDGTAGNAIDGLTVAVGSIVYHSGAAAKGSLGWRYQFGSGGNTYLTFGNSMVSPTVAYRWYFAASANPTANVTVWRIVNASLGNVWSSQLGITGVVTVRNAANSTIATSPAFTPGTRYRIECWVTRGTTTSNGRIGFRIFVGDDTTTPFFSYDATNVNMGTASFGRIDMGRSIGNSTITMDIDELVMDDGIGETFIGPPSADHPAAVTFTQSSTTDAAPLANRTAAVTSDVVSSVTAAPLANQNAALTSTVISSVTAAPLANQNAEVTSTVVSSVTAAPLVNQNVAVTITETAEVSAAPLANRNAAVTFDVVSSFFAAPTLPGSHDISATSTVVSSVSVAPIAQRIAAATIAITSAVTAAPLAFRTAAGTIIVTTTVSASPIITPSGSGDSVVYYRGSQIAKIYHADQQVMIR